MRSSNSKDSNNSSSMRDESNSIFSAEDIEKIFKILITAPYKKETNKLIELYRKYINYVVGNSNLPNIDDLTTNLKNYLLTQDLINSHFDFDIVSQLVYDIKNNGNHHHSIFQNDRSDIVSFINEMPIAPSNHETKNDSPAASLHQYENQITYYLQLLSSQMTDSEDSRAELYNKISLNHILIAEIYTEQKRYKQAIDATESSLRALKNIPLEQTNIVTHIQKIGDQFSLALGNYLFEIPSSEFKSVFVLLERVLDEIKVLTNYITPQDFDLFNEVIMDVFIKDLLAKADTDFNDINNINKPNSLNWAEIYFKIINLLSFYPTLILDPVEMRQLFKRRVEPNLQMLYQNTRELSVNSTQLNVRFSFLKETLYLSLVLKPWLKNEVKPFKDRALKKMSKHLFSYLKSKPRFFEAFNAWIPCHNQVEMLSRQYNDDDLDNAIEKCELYFATYINVAADVFFDKNELIYGLQQFIGITLMLNASRASYASVIDIHYDLIRKLLIELLGELQTEFEENENHGSALVCCQTIIKLAEHIIDMDEETRDTIRISLTNFQTNLQTLQEQSISLEENITNFFNQPAFKTLLTAMNILTDGPPVQNREEFELEANTHSNKSDVLFLNTNISNSPNSVFKRGRENATNNNSNDKSDSPQNKKPKC